MSDKITKQETDVNKEKKPEKKDTKTTNTYNVNNGAHCVMINVNCDVNGPIDMSF